MRNKVFILALLAAVPISAQQQQSADKDPTNKVKGEPLPAGWTVRLDEKDKNKFSASDTKFITMGKGYHVTSGPAALYYNAADQAKGAFTASASFGQRTGPKDHFEAYGLFLGGSNVVLPDQQYLYFLVRGDGKFYVAHRAGADVHPIVPWTENAAINKQNDAGAASNTIAIQVTADSVHMLANGQRVKSLAKSEMHGFNTDGQVGLRVNHNLDVHVGSFEIKK